MIQRDAALAIKRALEPIHSPVPVRLDELDPNYDGQSEVVLVADDGGPNLLHRVFAQPLIRVSCYAPGRSAARGRAATIADWMMTSRIAGVARVRNVSTLLTGRDTDTGARFASFTAPVYTRPETS